MPDATPARDSARIAFDRKHDLAVILEDVLIILDGEVTSPSSPESAAWLAQAQWKLTEALDACDALRDSITAAQAEVTRLARQVPVAADSPLRCPKPMRHEDKSVERCILHHDHMQGDTDHIDVHGHRAPVEIHESTIEQARMIAEEFPDG